ncbi:hypothetical protein VTH8203_02453 [Vibrio thalassae]|uniref:Uncharacterized protein n=2 Tax=Vibrio thalassae TaxID=1243014 RepID=A0A240EJQ1_9VIBR|nr:hypothetical protein VTH8203_02453 [Vibrio thalassae]
MRLYYSCTQGFIQRNGGNSVDDWFRQGALKYQANSVQLCLPWDGYNDHEIGDGNAVGNRQIAMAVTSRYLKGFRAINPHQKMIISRNVFLILGFDLKHHAEFIVCYTKCGTKSFKGLKNLSQQLCLKLAASYNIPVINLGNPDDMAIVGSLIERVKTTIQ